MQQALRRRFPQARDRIPTLDYIVVIAALGSSIVSRREPVAFATMIAIELKRFHTIYNRNHSVPSMSLETAPHPLEMYRKSERQP